MNRIKNFISIYIAAVLVFVGFTASASAQYDQGSRETRNLVRQLNSRIDDFKYSLNYELNRQSVGRIEENQIKIDIQNLKNTVIEFERKLLGRRENADDVRQIVSATRNIESFMNRFRFGSRVNDSWSNIRAMIDRLSNDYRVRDDRNDDDYYSSGSNRYPNNSPSRSTRSNYNSDLTGTYQLDAARSQDTRDIARRASRNSNIRSDDAREDLEDKLEAPEQIAVEVRGSQVVLASSKASPITFTADGTTRTETSNGRTIRVRTSLRGNELIVSSIGGDTDYTITFTPIDDGRALKVTRRITTEYLRQTVFAESIYTKTDSVARLGIDSGGYSDNDGSYSSNDPYDYPNNNSRYPRTSPGRTGQFVVPNGTMVTGVLENEISTKDSQSGDRFRLLVQTPSEFRGAVIEGYVSGIDRSGRVSGRSEMTFNFERITLRNGRTYDFAGNLQSIVDQNGNPVKIDQEGAAKSDSQTKETVKRSGIGAGIGAIIGAIAGGGKGAAIGAVIGGSAGAGSVIVQGKEDLELKQGSMITVQSSSPIR